MHWTRTSHTHQWNDIMCLWYLGGKLTQQWKVVPFDFDICFDSRRIYMSVTLQQQKANKQTRFIVLPDFKQIHRRKCKKKKKITGNHVLRIRQRSCSKVNRYHSEKWPFPRCDARCRRRQAKVSTIFFFRHRLTNVSIFEQKFSFRFPVHRIVLAASNPYFEKLFNESARNEIPILEVSGPTLKTIIDYCYGCVTKINKDNAENILVAASSLKLTELVTKCSNFWINKVDVSNCVDYMAFAEKYNIEHLKEKSFACICKRFEKIASDAMVCIDEKNFEAILREEDLSATEDKIFNAFVQWVQHDETNRSKLVPALANCIQLEHISKEVKRKKTSVFDSSRIFIGKNYNFSVWATSLNHFTRNMGASNSWQMNIAGVHVIPNRYVCTDIRLCIAWLGLTTPRTSWKLMNTIRNEKNLAAPERSNLTCGIYQIRYFWTENFMRLVNLVM